MKISVIMPVSRADTVHLTIQSIMRQDWANWEVVAVGQGNLEHPNKQQLKQIIENMHQKDSRVRYLHIEKQGATAARNAGVSASQGEIIAMIDDDCEARENWLSIIAQTFDANPAVDLIGGATIAPPPKQRWFAVCPTNLPAETIYDPVAMNGVPPAGWDWISANIAMRREVANRVGPWDEYMGPGSIFPAADDTDYMLRLEAMGVKMAATPRAIVDHTYGYRYGIRAVIKHHRSYAYGNGGLAGKLTLMGDPRGKAWLDATRQERLKIARLVKPHQFIRGAWRWQIFSAAYTRCVQNFKVEKGLLKPIEPILS